jgi:HAD superfamily hydrolase (TIGR01509 family)
MNLREYKAVLFDMDGVIVDSEPLHWKAELEAFEHFGIHVPAFEFHHFVGVPADKNFRYVIEKYGQGDEDLEAMLQFKLDYFTAHRGNLKPIEGAIRFIRFAHEQGLRLAVVTSSEREYQQFVLRLLGIEELFETCVTFEDVKHGKPDPEPYALACQRLGLHPSETVVIEDSLAGIASGKGAGCFVLGLATSFPEERLKETAADWVWPRYEEVEALSSFRVQ